METWWPATHHIGNTPFEAIFVEPRVGGRWYERNAEGELCDWGTVLAWDPPHRVRLSWHVGPGHDSAGLEGRPGYAPRRAKWRFGSRRKAGRPRWWSWNIASWSVTAKATSSCAVFDGPGAWSGILESFANVIASKHGGE